MPSSEAARWSRSLGEAGAMCEQLLDSDGAGERGGLLGMVFLCGRSSACGRTVRGKSHDGDEHPCVRLTRGLTCEVSRDGPRDTPATNEALPATASRPTGWSSRQHRGVRRGRAGTSARGFWTFWTAQRACTRTRTGLREGTRVLGLLGPSFARPREKRDQVGHIDGLLLNLRRSTRACPYGAAPGRPAPPAPGRPPLWVASMSTTAPRSREAPGRGGGRATTPWGVRTVGRARRARVGRPGCERAVP